MTTTQDADPPVRDFMDRSLRELLCAPANLRELLTELVPDLVDRFDFDKMQPAKREYLLNNWRTREADLLFEIPYRLPDREDWVLVCILLEHQTKADWRTLLITLIYAALYWEWQLRLWEQHPRPRPDFLLRPILPIVLHTGSLPWGTVKTLRELLVEPEVFRGFLPDWKPLFWEPAQHSSTDLLNSHAAFLQVMALLRIEGQEHQEAERTFLTALNQVGPLHDTNHPRWQDLVKFILGWAQHRRPIEERSNWQSIAEQFQTDEQRKREMNAMGMTIAQGIFAEGKIEGARGMLLRQGLKKLGEPDAATLQTIQSITDVDRLERMGDKVLDATSWADILGVN